MGGNKKKASKAKKGSRKGAAPPARARNAPDANGLGPAVGGDAITQLMTQPASVWQDAQALESLLTTQAGGAVGPPGSVVPTALDALLAAGGDLAVLEQKLLEVDRNESMVAVVGAMNGTTSTALQPQAQPKQSTGHARGIPKLLSQLRTATDEASILLLLSQILDITQTGDAADSVIRRENGIQLLVPLLSASNAKIQENAAKVLNNVAMDDANKKIIADCGAIQPLVSLLSSPVLDTQFSALYGATESTRSRVPQNHIDGCVRSLTLCVSVCACVLARSAEQPCLRRGQRRPDRHRRRDPSADRPAALSPRAAHPALGNDHAIIAAATAKHTATATCRSVRGGVGGRQHGRGHAGGGG